MPPRDYYLPQRTLVSQQDAALIENAQVPRSRFTGSWQRITAFNAGRLVPFVLEEILPGDHMSYSVEAYVRMATPLFPLFSNQRIDTFFFFVPNRLVWANWVRFMGEQPTGPSDSINFTIPQLAVPVGGFVVGSIFDHFGLPTAGVLDPALSINVNVLPLRAYNLIYNQWFRDQNIQTALTVRSTDTGDLVTDFDLRRRGKSHDYFTSALPWPQKFTAPTIPLGTKAPVASDAPQTQAMSAWATYPATDAYRQLSSSGGVLSFTGDVAALEANSLYADLSQATGVAINTFRQAFMIQVLLERDARGGTRYVELIKSHFGVVNPDFRVQRPEYIGGGQTPLSITPIAQTAPATGSVVGQLGAAGTAVGNHRASYAATEHGYIIGLINVRSELAYQQGLHKMWSRLTRYDFYWPSFAGLGEQAILRKEIYVRGDPALDDLVFGYQERWHEYRTRTSEVTGIMRSTATGTIDNWHLAQRFLTPPVLDSAFIEDRPDMNRVLAAGALADGQQYLADIQISRTAVRPIPIHGTPVTLGRF